MGTEGRVQVRLGWACSLFGLTLLLPPLPVMIGVGVIVTGLSFLLAGYLTHHRAHAQNARDAARAAHTNQRATTGLYLRLLSNQPPAPVVTPNLILPPHEPALLSVQVIVSRWTHHVMATRPRALWYLASDPLLMAVAALDDLATDREARALATPAWRNHCHADVVLTRERLLWCDAAGWNAIALADIAAYNHTGGCLHLDGIGIQPLRCAGPASESLAVYLDWLLRRPNVPLR